MFAKCLTLSDKTTHCTPSFIYENVQLQVATSCIHQFQWKQCENFCIHPIFIAWRQRDFLTLYSIGEKISSVFNPNWMQQNAKFRSSFLVPLSMKQCDWKISQFFRYTCIHMWELAIFTCDKTFFRHKNLFWTITKKSLIKTQFCWTPTTTWGWFHFTLNLFVSCFNSISTYVHQIFFTWTLR